MLPNLFILGPPKTATTSLADLLQTSPGVALPPLKEPATFTSGYSVRQRRVLLNRFYKNVSERWRLDATPWTIYAPDTIEAMAESGVDVDNAVFIAIYRDLEQRAQSMYLDQWRRRSESRSWPVAIADDLARLDVPVHPHERNAYVRGGRIADLTAQWQERVGEQFHVILFDDLVGPSQAEVLEDLGRVLDIDFPDSLRHLNTADHGPPTWVRTADRVAAVGRRVLPPSLRVRVSAVARPALTRSSSRSTRHGDGRPVPELDTIAPLAELAAEDREKLATTGAHIIGRRP